jgi:hypothetical protein
MHSKSEDRSRAKVLAHVRTAPVVKTVTAVFLLPEVTGTADCLGGQKISGVNDSGYSNW